MEFAYLSDITGNPVYKQKVEKIREVVASLERPKKLYPNYLHPKTGKWGQQHTSVGALGDSFYEYLLKEWLRSGKRDQQVRKFFHPLFSCKQTLRHFEGPQLHIFFRPRHCLTRRLLTLRSS